MSRWLPDLCAFFNEIALGSSLFPNFAVLMEKLLSYIFKPVRENMLFFLALMAAMLMPNVTMNGIGALRNLYLFACATMQSCFLAYVLCLLVTLISNRTAKIIVEIVLLLPFAVIAVCDTGSLLATKNLISWMSVSLIMETTTGEAAGFLRQFMTPLNWLLLVLFCAATAGFVAFCMWLWRKAERSRIWSRLILSLIVIFAVGGLTLDIALCPLLGFHDYARLTLWSGMPLIRDNTSRHDYCTNGDPLTRYLYIFKNISLFSEDYDKWADNQQNIWNVTQPSANTDDFDIVVLIGETCIRKHFQVYGYHLPTTPYLQAEKDSGRLETFDDVLAPSNYTTLSLRNVMSTNRLSDGEPWFSGAYFPMLVRKAGWDVYHYDNQARPSGSDVGLTKVFYTPLNMREVYTAVMDTTFYYNDMDYVEYVDSALVPYERPGKKMVIYHFVGQHFPYDERYPHPGRFSAADITADLPWLNDERRQQIADYDNATLHNDSVVGRLMERWQHRPAVMFYFGDHGDEVWDLGYAGVRNNEQWDDPAWVDRQFHVPFMIWMSDEFQRLYPEKAERIRQAATRRYGTIDLLGYMVLGLADPASPHYRPDRDLLNPHYDPQPRLSASGQEFDR